MKIILMTLLSCMELLFMRLTAVVTFLGLLPASLATGIGSDIQRPIATVIVGNYYFCIASSLWCFN
ncbi:MAG: hypothetical protein AB7I27_08290 [Bacteriovoracaceae bacterium]